MPGAEANPDEVVEVAQSELTRPVYREVLRQCSGLGGTGNRAGLGPTQELVVRCAFNGVVTTDYDPGILDTLMVVRPGV